MHTSRILVTCPKGLPAFLKQEILAMDLPVRSEFISGIETEGTFADTLRLNLFLRTGHRVLFLLREFTARDADDLYDEISTMPWEEYIPEDGYLCVTSNVDNIHITDSRFASLKCKDAIVDRIKGKKGKRPDSGPQRDHSVVHLYWKEQQCLVYLDTSGVPLSRRGYRKIPLIAPLQETLAAAIVLATGWEGHTHFINPMCGSGTLAIEAALIGIHRAPGMLRSNFGFMHMPGFPNALWDDMRELEKTKQAKHFKGSIIATDINPDAIDAARKNAASAGVAQMIDFRVCNFSDTPLPNDGGVIVVNPEYGERMGEMRKLEGTYKAIGDYFKNKCVGYTGYVFTGNPLLSKKVSLKPRKSLQFFNSAIECRLLEYDLYEGTRKNKRKHVPD